MELYKSHFYGIRALSNMQPGAGSTNSGKIDNLVQRDTTDGLPCINDTSLKGALREYSEYLSLLTPPLFESGKLSNIYGYKKGDDGAGIFVFQQANLLSMPVRCSHQPFYRATSIKILENLKERFELFGYSNTNLIKELTQFIVSIKPNVSTRNGLIFESNGEPKYFEDFNFISKTDSSIVPSSIKLLFGEDLAVFTETDFSILTDDNHLPVIPRNKLENGESKNLWYEQVLPRETRFGFIALQPVSDSNDVLLEELNRNLNGKVIQIGANASVGYGWCLVNKY